MSATKNDIYSIDIAACRRRQQRLLEFMRKNNLDLAIVTQNQHVQYLTGARFAWTFSPVAALTVNGHLTLVAPPYSDLAAADELLSYEAQWLCTLRNDQRAASSDVLLKALAGKPKPKRLGVEFSTSSPHLTAALGGELIDIEPELFRLRRRKDADELALLKKAIAGTGAMYRRAREIIAPGINELEVFNQLQAAATDEFGEMPTGTGNDYASGERGGPPRNRQAQAGELYLLDLGPAFRGYFADNCRAISVDGQPTDAQLRCCEHVQKVFSIVERTVKPGYRCQDLYREAKAWLSEAEPWVFDHHLGHGIGLYPHEAPHLNPSWDDTFQVGEVFACEPGLYAPELRAGIRLENDYLVTETGVELLSDFPLGLT